MYSPSLYSGDYTRITTCDHCGGSLVRVTRIFSPWRPSEEWRRIFNGDPLPEEKFCSKECKWTHAYLKALAAPGVRPTTPALAWWWACTSGMEPDRGPMWPVWSENHQ